MLVKNLLEQLKEYDPNDELIVAYWDKNTVSECLERDITDTQWIEIVDDCDDSLDSQWENIRWFAVEVLDKGDK